MQDIMLRIIGKQYSSGGDEDCLEFLTEGKFSRDKDGIELRYEESELSGTEGCTTSLKVSGDRIRMVRSGGAIRLDTGIEFAKGERHRGIYYTPFGGIEMEVFTNSVKNSLETDTASGSVDIDYNMSLKGLTETHSQLKIEIV